MMGSRRPPSPRARRERRLARLRDELLDEALPLPLEGPETRALLEEILYARHPPMFERAVPPYGCLIFTDGALDWRDAELGAAGWVAVDPARMEPSFLRRFADGRSSFVVREGENVLGMACFDHTVEYEASIVELQRSSAAIVVQRTDYDLVRICTSETVISWDGVSWKVKPRVWRFKSPILRLVPQADPSVLAGLLELCVHWLSPGRKGATLVWYLADIDPGAPPRLDLSRAQPSPELYATRREHFGALLSVLGQIDGAAIVGPEGRLSQLGVVLRASPRAEELVPPVGGTRHTSARRFSFDEPRAVVFVISQDGPVSVFSDGARTALMRPDRYATYLPEERLALPSSKPEKDRIAPCERCGKDLLVARLSAQEQAEGEDPSDELTCPVCETPMEGAARFAHAVRGVRKQLPTRDR